MKKIEITLLLCLMTRVLFGAVYTVENLNDSGLNSLRAAIIQANINPGLDEIIFNINNSSNYQKITLLTPLPKIIDPVIIDGYSHPGASEVLGTKRMQVSGAQLPSGQNIFFLDTRSSGSTIKGLILDGVKNGNGIYITSSDNHIYGNFIGTNRYGTAESGVPDTRCSIQILCKNGGEASGNQIGGSSVSQRNVISGNSSGTGIRVNGHNTTGNENIIVGNYIGLDYKGKEEVSNKVGIRTLGTSGLGIYQNVISGNVEEGVYIINCHSINTFSNLIGLNAAGNKVRSNKFGVYLSNTHDTYTYYNYVSGNTVDGIRVAVSVRNSIRGNYIGFYQAENLTATCGNGYNGIYITAGSTSNEIGGPNLLSEEGGIVVSAGNFISGNQENGIRCDGSSNIISGNIIGLSRSGNETPNTVLTTGNGAHGILLYGQASKNRIGSSLYGEEQALDLAEANIIGTNGKSGIAMEGKLLLEESSTSGETIVKIIRYNKIIGNLIGVNARQVAVPNREHGIHLVKAYDASIWNNIIGNNEGSGIYAEHFWDGPWLGISLYHDIAWNLIGLNLNDENAGNGADGITIELLKCTIRRNIICSNKRYGIGIISTSYDRPSGENTIAENRIGLSRLYKPAGNLESGIYLGNSSSNIIGSQDYATGPDAPNVIAYNGGDGIFIDDAAFPGQSGSLNTIYENSIYSNAGNGIQVAEENTSNSIISNQIFDNGALGIDLRNTNGAVGVDVNDQKDPDEGGNNGQNFPIIEQVYTINNGAALVVRGRLNSEINENYLVEIFLNELSDVDPSDYGEGHRPLHYFNLTTDFNGDVQFNVQFSLANSLPANAHFVATATRIDGFGFLHGTSEFSENQTLGEAPSMDTPNLNYAAGSVENSELLVLYPNPTTQAIQLELPAAVKELVDVSIFDSSGKLVLRENAPADDFKGGYKIDVSSLTAGTYLLQTSSHAYSGHSTFVKH